MNWSTTFTPPPALDVPKNILDDLTANGLPHTKDALLQLWEIEKKALANIKESEMELRKICVKFLVPEPKEGVNNVELGNGYTAKANIKLNYKLVGTNDEIEKNLDLIEAVGNEGKFIAERLVGWTANLSVSEYKKLIEDAKTSPMMQQVLDLMNKMIVIEDGAPTLTIQEPKKKK